MSRHITIIGAGLVGLATAFELTELDPECSVSILDPAPLSGASHHAAGMLAPAAEMQYQQDALVPSCVNPHCGTRVWSDASLAPLIPTPTTPT